MGGAIGVMARYADGSIQATDRGWTNPLPNCVRSLALDAADESKVRSYLDHYEPTATGDRRIPNEYGFAAFDFVTKTFLHCQGYSQMIAELQFFEALANTRLGLDQGIRTRMEALHEAGRLVLIGEQYDEKHIHKKEVLRRSSRDYETLDAFLTDAYQRVHPHHHNLEYKDRTIYTVISDISPWTVRRFEESPKGFEQLKTALIDLGIVFTEEEDAAWVSYIGKRFAED